MTKDQAREEIQDHLLSRMIKGQSMMPINNEVVVRKFNANKLKFKAYTLKELYNIAYKDD